MDLAIIDHDWYPGGVPSNVLVGEDVFLETSYSLAAIHPLSSHALVLGRKSGAYLQSTFVIGPEGRVIVGESTIINGSYIVCSGTVEIGSNCLLAWGSFITDSWPSPDTSVDERRRAVANAAGDARRPFPNVAPRNVKIEDNVWVGFGAVIMPGVTLGRGCVVGAQSIVSSDVPPYSVVVGNPARVVRYLEPTDQTFASESSAT